MVVSATQAVCRGPNRYRMHKKTLQDHELLLSDVLCLVLMQGKENEDIFCIPCTASEYHILCQLFWHIEEVVPFQTLFPYPKHDLENRQDRALLNRHISRLRRKLPPYLWIGNKRQEGYCLTYVS